MSVEASLKKLRTSYIDILYLHWWDYRTSVEEVMNSLHNLVVQGKVLYLVSAISLPVYAWPLVEAYQGVSDTPAWVVAKANQYARDHGKTPFVIYQGAWNVMQRDFERDILPMCQTEGLALAPWNVLNKGKFRTDEEEERRRVTGEGGRTLATAAWERNEDERKMVKALEKVAKEVGTDHPTAGLSSLYPPYATSVQTCAISSGHCICDAESAVRVPHHRGSQSGPSPVEP